MDTQPSARFYVIDLADQLGIRYQATPEATLADIATRLAGDDVVTLTLLSKFKIGSTEIALLNFLEHRGYPATALMGAQQVARSFTVKRGNRLLEPFQCLFPGFPDLYRLIDHVDCVLCEDLFQTNRRNLLPFPKRFWHRGVGITLGN